MTEIEHEIEGQMKSLSHHADKLRAEWPQIQQKMLCWFLQVCCWKDIELAKKLTVGSGYAVDLLPPSPLIGPHLVDRISA